MDKQALATFIDHTILKVDTSLQEINKLCKEAIKYQFASVCIPPYFVSEAKDLLIDSTVKVSTVVGFPMGFNNTAAKVEEIKRVALNGADEIDAVINITALLNKDWNFVKNDIESMVNACHIHGKIAKIIIETAYLRSGDMSKLAKICSDAHANFVKTSTGFASSGADVEDILKLRKLLPAEIKIKASGGIKNKTSALKMIKAGADRIGTSSAILIIS